MHELLSFLKYIITTNTFNFALMLIILGWVIKKVNIGQILGNGITQIDASIKKSEDEKSVAQKHFEKAQSLVNGLADDIKNLDKNCDEKIKVFETKISENTEKNISDIGKNVEKIISIEEKKISNLVSDSVAKQSIEEAKSKIISMLETNPGLHQKFIQNSIDELDKVKL